MWVAKFKIKHDCLIGNRCEKFHVHTQGLPFNIQIFKGKTTYVPQIQTLFGDPKAIKNFVDDLRKDKRVQNFHKDKNNIFFVEVRNEKIPSTFYYNDIIFIEPVRVDIKGYEYWTIGSYQKEVLIDFFNKIKNSIKEATLKTFKYKRIKSIYFSHYLSLQFGPTNKKHLSDLEREFWKLWHWLYPVYKKIYPSMNKDFYAANIQSHVKKIKGTKTILISGAADYDTITTVFQALKKIKAQHSTKITLIDISDHALEISKRFVQRNHIKAKFIQADILRLPKTLRETTYDIILTDGFLDYFNKKEKQKIIETWFYILKKGGRVFTTIPIKYSNNFTFFDQIHDYIGLIQKAKKKKYPIQKVLLYDYKLDILRETLRRKTGKHTAFNSLADLKQYAQKVNFKLMVGKTFYTYKSLGWKWKNIILEKPA